LINLEHGVDQESEVGNAKADHLDCILQPQRVPRKKPDVEEAKDEEGQESRYRSVGGLELIFIDVGAKAGLELGKNIAIWAPVSFSNLMSLSMVAQAYLRLKGDADCSLQGHNEEEGLGPFGGEGVELRAPQRSAGRRSHDSLSVVEVPLVGRPVEARDGL